MSPTHKRIFLKLKHKNDKYGNIANVANLRKTLLSRGRLSVSYRLFSKFVSKLTLIKDRSFAPT